MWPGRTETLWLQRLPHWGLCKSRITEGCRRGPIQLIIDVNLIMVVDRVYGWSAWLMLSAKFDGLPGLDWSPEGIDFLGRKRTEPKLLLSEFDRETGRHGLLS